MKKKRKECNEVQMNLEEAKLMVKRLNYVNMAWNKAMKYTYVYCRYHKAYHLRKPVKFKTWL